MRRHRQRGLTLLEALVALSIFAVIGAASYQVLAAVIDAKDRLAQAQQSLAGQQMAMQMIERDIRQMIVRDVRQANESMPYLVVGDGYIAFTRNGLSNPLGLPRSHLQRLSYDIGTNPWQDEQGHPLAGRREYFLRRVVSSALDAANDKPSIQLLFPAQSMAVEVISQGKRYTSWPPANTGSAMSDSESTGDVVRPDGLYITLDLGSGQPLSRWLKVF